MEIKIEKFASNDSEDAIKIWNEIVFSGNAFPQDKPLSMAEGEDFFKSQSFTGIAKNEKEIVGLYILHPNNVGRCGHIANASYAVSQKARGQGVGELLVKDSIKKPKIIYKVHPASRVKNDFIVNNGFKDIKKMIKLDFLV